MCSSVFYSWVTCLFIFALYVDNSFSYEYSYAQLDFVKATRAFKPSVMSGITSCLKTNNTLLKFPLLDPDYDHNKIIVYKFLELQKHSYIFFIEDAQANHYVIKQQRSGSLAKQFWVICEILCAHMAELLGIPAHLVRLLPAGVAFPGKFLTDMTASLHTKVPGITIRELTGNPYAKLDIKQNNDPHLPFEQMGLNKRVITNMAIHPTLPLIVALDTFVGNRDRNKANLIFDEENNAFYAIDMSLIYDITDGRKLLALLSCEQVEIMIDKKEVFTDAELEALIVYQETLIKLVSYFTPKKIVSLMHTFALDAGFNNIVFFNGRQVLSVINEYKDRIKTSYLDSKRLIDLLSILINNSLDK